MFGWQPVYNWKQVLKYAWSVRLMLLAAVLSGAEVAINVIVAYEINTPIPRGLFAALSGIVTVLAFIARFFSQRKVSGGQ